MKRFLLLILASWLLMGMKSQETKLNPTVAEVKLTAQNHDHVILTGRIVAKAGQDEYVFVDDTGSIVVCLEERAKQVAHIMGRSLNGMQLEIKGFVENRAHAPLRIRVQQLDIVD